ncbi:MAG: hypothetical protein ACRCS8_02005 [Brevinema sp.]
MKKLEHFMEIITIQGIIVNSFVICKNKCYLYFIEFQTSTELLTINIPLYSGLMDIISCFDNTITLELRKCTVEGSSRYQLIDINNKTGVFNDYQNPEIHSRSY